MRQKSLGTSDLEKNEIADTLTHTLAKVVSPCEAPELSAPFTFLEIFSKIKHQNKTTWIVPLPHQSTFGISVLVLEAYGFNRQEQTILVRFRNGHLKSMKFSEGSKSFEMCTNCSSEPASSAHILECLGFNK
ncbi:RNase H domain-containing protein [Trichonephila clavipes]|uniref:RNase H domain-containing protein n=1 Tax=Trichonephila clavipes TaxID=2585209 RepID=A0A8X7BFP9_TRICX|nr:RNase H domain-containing protein [Trichonephila clavipes]